MTNDPVRLALLDAYADLELPDPLEQVVRRGQRVRGARRRTALGSATALALAGAVIATRGGTPPASGSQLQLAAANLPTTPVSLDHVPVGLRLSTDLDGGPLRLLYVGAAGAEVVLTTSSSAPNSGAAVASGTAVLTWRYSTTLWVTLTGFDRYDNPTALQRLKPDVVSRPVSLAMHLTAAPEGWQVTSYKDTLPEGGGVLTLTDPAARDARTLTIDVEANAYEPVDPNTLEDPGPLQHVIVHGHRASLVKGHRTWFLRAPLDSGSSVTLQAPNDLTEDQVLEIANGVSRTR